MITWRDYLNRFDEKIIACSLSEEELDMKCDSFVRGVNGKGFAAWSEKNVYILVCCDESERIIRVSRNPDDADTEHVGG